MNNEVLTLCGVGDILCDREAPGSMFTNVTTLFQKTDVVFGQLELPVSVRGEPIITSRSPIRAHPRLAKALKAAGFHVLSFAGNHSLDYGNIALLDTIEHVKSEGMAIVGVGENLAQARQPAIIERNGTRMGFLSYNSILPPGNEAFTHKPGCAPLKIWTFYQPLEGFQPGTPCRILTFANDEDLAAMKEDIKKLRTIVDILVVSMHWGLHHAPASLAMYQREIGHAAIDAGADLILGHHPHILKPIETYKGKVIFHSLGNFIAEVPLETMNKWKQNPEMRTSRLAYELETDPEFPNFPFHRDSRKTMIAKCYIKDKKIEKVTFIPVMINQKLEPEIVLPNDDNFEIILKYMREIGESQGINTQYAIDNSEINIDTTC
ncbi:CapA family protein [Chloroflexota bacterium]